MKEDLVEHLAEMGYEGHSTLHNLSVVRFFLILNLIRLVLYPIALLMAKKRPKSVFWKQVASHLRESLIFQDLIVMCLYGFLETIITGYITVKSPRVDTGAHTLGVILIWGIWLFTVIVLPLLLLYACVHRYQETQEHRNFKKWFGHLIYNEAGGISHLDRKKKSFFLVFLAQRWIFLVAVFTLFGYPCMQVLLLLLVYSFVIIYKGKKRPVVLTHFHRLEMANEWFLFALTLTMFGFTDYVADPKTKCSFGKLMIVLMAGVWFVNMLVIGIMLKECL
jgi:hypothetical protein